MDPNAAYDAMITAWQAGDYAEAYNRADDLLQWLAGGGFAPDAPRDVYYARMIRKHYASGVPTCMHGIPSPCGLCGSF